MPYDLNKMKESLERCGEHLKKISNKECKKDFSGFSENSSFIGYLIDAVVNMHVLVEEAAKGADVEKEAKISKQEIEREQVFLELLEENNIKEEIDAVVDSFPESVRGEARMLCEFINNNFKASKDEYIRLSTSQLISVAAPSKS